MSNFVPRLTKKVVYFVREEKILVELLVNNPLLLLFVVAAIGYPLGKIKIGGNSLGVAAVLFVGLGVGSLSPDLKLPEIIYSLGLVLFVYTVGISSGAAFFVALRDKGWRDNVLVVGMLTFAAGGTILANNLLSLKATLSSGMFAGSLTNTPALAAILEYIKGNTSGKDLDQRLIEPVVGYSITYPLGVIGVMLAIYLAQRFWKIDYAAEAHKLNDPTLGTAHLLDRTLLVTNAAATKVNLEELVHAHHWTVVFGRLKHNGVLSLANSQVTLSNGDLISVIGTADQVDKVVAYLGKVSTERLELDRSKLDFRRVFVSNPKIVGRKLSDLHLPQSYGAIITRIRRGDLEFLPQGDTILELGDRVRVVTQQENMEAVSTYLGDSYRALSEIDVMTFSLGLALGLLVGLIPIPIGGITIKLGNAGGPLIVALILGKLERTGPIVWTMPYNANLTLRQVGLVMFLAGVGIRAGYPFVDTFTKGGGIYLFIAGGIITFTTAMLTLIIGYKFMKVPMGRLIGIVAGLQTQPAVLGYALEQTGNELPNVGYAAVYPSAMITKTLLAQFILVLLLGG